MSAGRAAILLALIALIAAAGWGARPQPVSDAQRIERIASELRCPVCQGLSVQDSPAETAREMRGLVAQRVAEGKSDEDIRAEFRRAYGDWVFLAPPVSGPSGLVWLLPLLLVAGGGVVALGRIRRAAAPARTAPTAVAADPRVAELRARVAREEATEG